MSWHALLAPLPADAVPIERPLASSDVLASAEGAAIAGWRQLVVDLSAGGDGLRVVLVLLDADGALISASDAVVHRREEGPAVRFGHETVGGRFEPDGRFAGRHWTSVSVASPVGGSAGGNRGAARAGGRGHAPRGQLGQRLQQERGPGKTMAAPEGAAIARMGEESEGNGPRMGPRSGRGRPAG